MHPLVPHVQLLLFSWRNYEDKGTVVPFHAPDWSQTLIKSCRSTLASLPACGSDRPSLTVALEGEALNASAFVCLFIKRSNNSTCSAGHSVGHLSHQIKHTPPAHMNRSPRCPWGPSLCVWGGYFHPKGKSCFFSTTDQIVSWGERTSSAPFTGWQFQKQTPSVPAGPPDTTHCPRKLLEVTAPTLLTLPVLV